MVKENEERKEMTMDGWMIGCGSEMSYMSDPNDLRIPDGTEGGDAAAPHAVDNLLGEGLVRDDSDGLGVELLDEAESQLDHVGLAMLASIWIGYE